MKFKSLCFVFALVFAFSSVASARRHHRHHHHNCHGMHVTHVTQHSYVQHYAAPMPMMMQPMPMFVQPAPVVYVPQYPQAYMVQEVMQPVWPSQALNLFFSF